MNIRFNGFCKIISTILIATFLSYNISWANPDMNLATSGMAGSLFEEDGEISKIKWFVELALRDNKAYEASQSPVEVFLKDKKEQGDGTSIIPCHVGERIYRARVSKKKHVINVSRVGSVENINLMAFKVAKSRQLEFIPVISANDPLIKEYRDTFDTSRISAPVVAESPIFLQEVREYAANNPEKTFVIMPETFFNDSPVVLKSFNDLRDAEKMIKEIKTAIEEKREKDARASIGSLREQAANLPEVIGKVIEQEVGILSKRIEEMDSPKKVGDDKPTIHEKGLSVIEKILDALINPSKVTLILILCIFMAYFPMVRASSVQKALTAPQAEKGSGRIVKTISSNQLKVRGNEVVLDMKDADVSRDLTGYVLEVIFKSGKSARLELLFKDSKWRNVYSYLMSPVNGVTRFDPAVDPRKVDKFKDFSNIKVVGIKSFTMNGKRLKSMIKGFRLIKGGTKAIAPEKGASVEKTSIRRSTIKPKISGGLDTGATASSMKRAMDVSMYGWKVQDYRDSRAIQSAGVDNKGQVWAEADLDANSSTISKGEVYIDFLYNMKRKIFDLRKTEITAWVYIPEELVNRKDPSNPNGIQLFLKDDKWENSYGTWCNVSASGWKKVQFIPLGNDKTDLSRIQILGVKIGAGGRSSFKGKGTIKIRDVKIKPVSWVPKLVADNPLDLPWRVQDYSDSQGFCSIKRTKKGLEISVDMKGGDPHKSKGEICLSLLGGVQLPGRSKGVQDLSNTKIVVTLEVSDGLVFRPFNGAHLASKSEDEKGRVRSQYGYWKNIVSPGEMTLTYTPTRAPQAPQEWDEEGFDPTRISELIIKLGTGGGSTFAFKGKIIVKSIKFEKAFFPKAPRLITTPYLREVPRKVTPISKKEFNKLSGASKYYSASTYGHDVGGSRGFRA